MIGVTPEQSSRASAVWRGKLLAAETTHHRAMSEDVWARLLVPSAHNSVFLHSANSLNLTLIGCDPKSAIAKLIGSLKRRGPMLPGLTYNTSSLVRMSGRCE